MSDADFVSDEENSRIRASLRMALQRGPANLDTLAKRARVAHGYLSSFHRNTRRLRRDSAARLCEVLGIPGPGLGQAAPVDPLWALAERFGADRALVEARPANATVYLLKRDSIVRTFQGRTFTAALAEMQRCAS
jgi:transcriptional regulator with XRE-family HTH domain